MADIFNRWKTGLFRTSKAAFGRVAGLLGATEINSDFWDELEAILIQADMGVETSQSILSSLQTTVRGEGVTRATDLKPLLEMELLSRLGDSTSH